MLSYYVLFRSTEYKQINQQLKLIYDLCCRLILLLCTGNFSNQSVCFQLKITITRIESNDAPEDSLCRICLLHQRPFLCSRTVYIILICSGNLWRFILEV